MRGRLFSAAPVLLLIAITMVAMPPGGPGGGGGKGKGGGGSTVEFFIDAAAGDDANDGSESAPFATLERAQGEVRAELANQTGDIIVNLNDGVHHRSATFTLTDEDSGNGEHRVVYRSTPGQQAIIEGGVELSGWQPSAGALYEVDAPAGVSDFRQFYAASERQPRARSASASGTATEFLQEFVIDKNRDAAMVVPNSVLGGIAHPEDLELLYVGVLISGHGIVDGNGNEVFRPSWRSHRLQVEQVSAFDAAHTRVDIQQDALYHASQRGFAATFITPQDPFFLENAYELLDEEGEWFFDPRDRKLFWWPPAGVDPNGIDTWIPAVETLLDLDGAPDAPVENITIEDLVFRHSTYLVTNQEGYVSGQGPAWFTGWEHDDWMSDQGISHSYLSRVIPQGLPGGAIEIDSAHGIEFNGNVLTELGAAGIVMHNDVVDTVVSGNVFDDLSGSALIAGHEEHVYIDEPMERLVERVTVADNLVAGVGREYFTGVGVRVFKSADFTIERNDFVDTPYSAISMGWGHNNFPDSSVHRRNTIAKNRFENVMHTLYDGSAIYLLGPAADIGSPTSEGTEVSGNYVDYSGSAIPSKLPGDSVDPTFAKRPGLQFDDGTRNAAFSKNVVVDGTVWFQLTDWFTRSGSPGFIEGLGLSGSNNWSNVEASVPSDLGLVGAADVKLFDPDGRLKKALTNIIDAAGVSGTLPQVP